MPMTPLQQEFIRRLKNVIRSRGLRQADIARELAITSSAVSQIMHGKIHLAPERFREAAEKLGFPPLETYELTRMLHGIKAGEEQIYSPWNQRIYSSRHAKGFSLARLSIESGIPMERLRELEENSAQQPSAAEINRLQKVFSRRDVLWEIADSCSSDPLVPLFAQEKFSCLQLPLLMLRDFREYQKGEDLAAFAAAHTRRTCQHAVVKAKNPVALAASGRELGFAYPGTLLLIIAEKRPFGYGSFLLRCAANNRFVLRVPPDTDDGASPFLFGTPVPDEAPPRWELPVLELGFAPVDIRSFDYGFF